jgi:hypothetical protein
LRQLVEEEHEVRQRELPFWKAKQLEPEGQEDEAQSWVQVPPVQLVLPLEELSGMHRLPWQPALMVQAEPTGRGGTLQTPVAESQVSESPQDQPRRQSGRQALASGEQTYPLRQSLALSQSDTQYEVPSPSLKQLPCGHSLTLQLPEQYPPIHARPFEVLLSLRQTPVAQD